jgi:hypothetical protein
MVLPPPAGNRRAVSHGAHISKFTPAEQAEIAQLEDQIRELTGHLPTPAIEPLISVLAAQWWRYGRLVEYLAERKPMRGRADRVQLNPAQHVRPLEVREHRQLLRQRLLVADHL